MIALLIGTLGEVVAQRLPEPYLVPDTAASLQKLYRVGGEEFLLGAYVTKFSSPLHAWGGDINADSIWYYLHSLGCNVMYTTVGSDPGAYLTPFVRRAGVDDRIMVVDYIGGAACFGRDIELYPWDSAQVEAYQNKFRGWYGGIAAYNATEVDTVVGVGTTRQRHEQHYATANGDTAGETILWHIAYGWQPQHVKRYRTQNFSWSLDIDSAQNSWEMATQRDPRVMTLASPQHTYYVGVTGHLGDTLNPGAANSDAVLRIEIWNEVPKGTKYVDSSGVNAVDSSQDREFLYATINIPKDSLRPTGTMTSENYRTPSFPINLDNCSGCMGGPLRNEKKRFDVRVYWTGKEAVYLRSISLRDSIGQLVDGRLPGSATFRQRTMDTAKYWLLGSPSYPIDSLRPQVIGLGGGTEAHPFEFKPFATINKMIRDTFNLARKIGRAGLPGDSVPVWQYDVGGRPLHQLGNISQSHVYSYLSEPRDTLLYINDEPIASRFDVPYAQLPTVRQHNGGRFHLPMFFDVDSLGIARHDTTLARRVEDYESILQQSFFGKFYPDGLPYPFHDRIIPALGSVATTFRGTGHRMIQVPGLIASLEMRTIGPAIDTIAGHFPEPSELLAIANLGLCYGSRGTSWWRFNDDAAVNSDSSIGPDGIHWYNGENTCCVGANGLYVSDTSWNYVHRIHRWRDTSYAIIRNYYIGWRDRVDLARAITRNWLASVGPIMARLRWRNSYSVHAASRWISPRTDTPSVKDNYIRAIPDTEIVIGVTTRPVGDTTLDPPGRTFVEIGLFDLKRDTLTPHERMNDTAYVMVVNRRTFEPWRTLGQDTVVNILDTLAEHRTIRLQLNMSPLDSSGYNFVRVRDAFPSDTAWLADNAGWSRIDTVVSGDSAVTLTLAPGRAALLEITPASWLLTGDSRFNGQKKILYDGRRYHTVYHRYNGSEYGSFYDTIFYRRSLPVADSLATIRWEGVEHPVSVATISGDATRNENRFPSMTLRDRPYDTTVTFTWDCHADAFHAAAGQREIVTRDFRVGRHWVGASLVPYEVWSSIGHIDWHYGVDPVVWGTPVISRLDAAEVIAWSDSTLGIVARSRLPLDSVQMTILFPPVVSAPLSLSQSLTTLYGRAGNRQSVPPFAHIASHDSTCAVVWQQPASTPNSLAMYVRVRHDSVLITGLRLNAVAPPLAIGGPGLLGNPSVDQTQDALGRIQDGVVWESIEPYFSNALAVNFASIVTTGSASGPACFPAMVQAQKSSGPGTWPSTGSLNRIFTLADTAQEPLFAVAFHSIDDYWPMGQALVSYGNTSFKTGWPQPYALGGWYPNAAGAPVKQSTRQAAFYRGDDINPSDPNTLLTTNRQFFMKGRPRGYMADGRAIRLRVSDSLGTGFVAGMHDVWIATETGGQAASMIPRSPSFIHTDSISQVESLLRTGYFTASDSVTLGATLFGMFYGDTAVAASSRIECVTELVDSATGSVVARLDSFMVSAVADSHVHIEPDLHLASGTYMVRMRIGSPSMPADGASFGPRYPVTELASRVANDDHLGKLLGAGREGSAGARISARPNPVTAGTRLTFSVPVDGYVTLGIADGYGREVERPVDHVWSRAGQYTVDVDMTGRMSGTYLARLSTGGGSAVVRLVVVH